MPCRLRSLHRQAFLGLAFALFPALLSAAQPQPESDTSPVHFIVPGQAGGGASLVARAIGDRLAVRWNRPVIVDNHPGAAGLLGMDLVAKSKPDGQTMLLGFAGAVTINPSLYKLPYRPIDDFTPVTLIGSEPFVMVINPAVPAANLKEFIQYAQAHPGAISYSSSGNGSSSHLAGELFKTMTHVDMLHVPYRGSMAALTDVLGGQVGVHFSALSTAIPQIKSGRVRALGVTSLKRSSVLPDVPTIDEAGVPGFAVDNWYAIFYPAGTPDAIVQRTYRDVRAIVAEDEVRKQFALLGIEPVGSTTSELAQTVRSDIDKWAAVVKQSHMKID
jgi:tripartite-type tricarboxylate transporter receptor subunit TctC